MPHTPRTASFPRLRAFLQPRLTRWSLAVLLFVSLVGLNRPFNSDEVWTLRAVSQPWTNMMDELRADVHPPAHYVLLRLWIALVGGTDETAVRSLSVLLYATTCAALFFGTRWVSGTRAGLCSALLFLSSPLAILVAQYGRMYALLGLAAAISTCAWARILLRRDTSSRTAAIYVVAGVLGTLTHIWFFFLLAAQVVFGHTMLRRILVLTAASVAPYGIFWGPALLRQVGTTSEALAWLRAPQPLDLPKTLLFLAPVLCLALPLVARSLWSRQCPPVRGAAAVLVGVSLVTILVPFLLSFWKPIFSDRFTIVALAPLALGAALAASPRIRRQLAVVLLVAAVVFSVGRAAFRNTECDARATARMLAERTQDGDTVIFTNLSRLPVDYYWDQIEPDRGVAERSFPASIDAHPGFEGVVTSDEMAVLLGQEAAALAAQLQRRPGSIFLLHRRRARPDGILIAALDSNFSREPRKCTKFSAASNYIDTITAWSAQRR